MKRLLLFVATIALVLAACGGGDESADSTSTTTPTTAQALTTTTTAATTTSVSTTTTSTTTTTTTTLPPGPLNGLGVADETLLDRRVVAVKIDNHPKARPQSGIQEADAAYELLVEGGLTRFIALFHQSDTEYLGPIRSGRPTDPTLLKHLGAVFQISGAQDWVISRINNAGVKILGETGSTFRIRTRKAPHNLYGNTEVMRSKSDDRGWSDEPPTVPIFDFGDVEAPTESATTISLSWSSDWTPIRWVWDGEHYLRFIGDDPHNWIDIEGNTEQITFDTLVVLTATRYTARPSGKGTPVPALETVGSGEAYAFYNGGVVEGTWERDNIESPFTVELSDGSVMMLPPGRPWILIFPNSRPLSWE